MSLAVVLSVSDYFGIHYSPIPIVGWCIAQATLFQFYTPGVLRNYAHGNPNGALWTIPMEIMFYICAYKSWDYLKKKREKFWLALIFLSILINIAFGVCYDKIPQMIAKIINITPIPYAFVFLIGMFIYNFRDKYLWKVARAFPYLFIIYILWFCIKWAVGIPQIGHYADVVCGIFVILITISGGYYFKAIRLKHELSYGLYISHDYRMCVRDVGVEWK